MLPSRTCLVGAIEKTLKFGAGAMTPSLQRCSINCNRHMRSVRYAGKMMLQESLVRKQRVLVVHYSTTHRLFVKTNRPEISLDGPALAGHATSLSPAFDEEIPAGSHKFLLPNGKHISVGMTAEKRKTFTRDDVQSFARISTDTNPIHLNEEFAQKTRFGRCIVHGALTNGLVSGVVGTELPGAGCIVLRQLLKFPNPLYVGEAVAAQVRIAEIYENRVRVIYRCVSLDSKQTDVSKKIVMEGEALLVIPHMKMVS